MFLNKIWFCCLFISFSVFSQKKEKELKDSLPTHTLEEVIVTATKTVRQLSSVPMPVTLIPKQQIQQSGSVRLRDILAEQTGGTLIKDVGNSEGVQLQGIAADYTLILIDGVPVVGRTSGNIDLNRITVNNIRQIEVVKGPSSALYGSEAMGGVINIITEQPLKNEKKGEYHVFTRGGAKKELDINGTVSYKKDRFGITGGVNLNTSGGFDLTPKTPLKTTYPHTNYTIHSQLGYDFSKQVKVTISSRYYHQNQYVETYTNSETDWNLSTQIQQQLSDKWGIDYTFYGTRYTTISTLHNSTSQFNRSLFRPEIKTQLKLESGDTFIGGIGINFDALDRTSINGAKQFKAWYSYVQYDFTPVTKLNLILGARYENSNSYASAFSPKISSSYKISPKLMLKGSVGYGFKIPDFRQLFFDFNNVTNGYIVLGTHTIHNRYETITDVSTVQKQLKPETSIGYNIGFQWKPVRGVKINVNGFRNDIKDLIDTYDTRLESQILGLPQGTRVFSYRNINNVFTQGVEVDIDYKINKNFHLLTGYQWLDSGNKEEIAQIKNGVYYKDTNGVSQELDNQSYVGLANRSKHMINARLFYENQIHQFSLSLRGVYRSKYVPFDTNNNSVIDEFDHFVKSNIQLNTALTKTIFNGINVQLGVDNVLNETGTKNKALFNYTDANGNIIPNEAYLQLGRTYYGKLQFNF